MLSLNSAGNDIPLVWDDTSVNFAIGKQTNRSQWYKSKSSHFIECVPHTQTCHLNFECRSAPVQPIKEHYIKFHTGRLNADKENTSTENQRIPNPRHWWSIIQLYNTSSAHMKSSDLIFSVDIKLLGLKLRWKCELSFPLHVTPDRRAQSDSKVDCKCLPNAYYSECFVYSLSTSTEKWLVVKKSMENITKIEREIRSHRFCWKSHRLNFSKKWPIEAII